MSHETRSEKQVNQVKEQEEGERMRGKTLFSSSHGTLISHLHYMFTRETVFTSYSWHWYDSTSTSTSGSLDLFTDIHTHTPTRTLNIHERAVRRVQLFPTNFSFLPFTSFSFLHTFFAFFSLVFCSLSLSLFFTLHLFPPSTLIQFAIFVSTFLCSFTHARVYKKGEERKKEEGKKNCTR